MALDEPVYIDEYVELPDAGLLDTLAKKTGVGFVGNGVEEQIMDCSDESSISIRLS